MKKMVLFVLWLPFVCFTLAISLFNLYSIYNFKAEKPNLLRQSGQKVNVVSSPEVLGSFSSTVYAADARPELIRRYLEKYKSPLLPYTDNIIQASDKYGIDFRLIVAIAQCESNVCKVIPSGSYNCWGFENGSTKFKSWEHAIERVAKTLKENYYDYGLTTPDEIMPKYAPPSVAKGGPWAKCVNQFMDELQ